MFPFRLYGHRGAAAHEPENTLRSFRAALRDGADALETDVRLTADGQVVVFHDASGQRTCGRPERLAERPWAEVRGWDAGLGERPVLLSELFEAFPGVFVNIDVKDEREDAARATLDVVRRCAAEGRTGLGSFHPLVSRALRAAGWRGQLALGPSEVAAMRFLPGGLGRRLIRGDALQIGLGRRLIRGDALQIPVESRGIRLDGAPFIAKCHAAGLRVDYWTIDDPEQAVALVRAGANGIVSNDPGAIRRALAR